MPKRTTLNTMVVFALVSSAGGGVRAQPAPPDAE